MLQTAEQVAKRYQFPASARMNTAPQSAARGRGARAGRFDEEIVRMPVVLAIVDERRRTIGTRESHLASDEGIRPDTTLRRCREDPPRDPRRRHRGGQRQSVLRRRDACVVMDGKLAERRALSRWAFSAALPSPAASPTRWESAPSSRSRNC